MYTNLNFRCLFISSENFTYMILFILIYSETDFNDYQLNRRILLRLRGS